VAFSSAQHTAGSAYPTAMHLHQVHWALRHNTCTEVWTPADDQYGPHARPIRQEPNCLRCGRQQKSKVAPHDRASQLSSYHNRPCEARASTTACLDEQQKKMGEHVPVTCDELSLTQLSLALGKPSHIGASKAFPLLGLAKLNTPTAWHPASVPTMSPAGAGQSELGSTVTSNSG
jgi:hypothetical protein